MKGRHVSLPTVRVLSVPVSSYLVVGLVMTAMLVVAGGVQAADHHVWPGDSIQAAIDAAGPGDTVIVHQGTYYERIDFKGKAITVRSEDPSDQAVVDNTAIDGGGGGSVVTFASGEGSSSVLAGLTITNGTAENGGGINCFFSSPTIQGNTITHNTAVQRGGGIYCHYGSPTIQNNTITDNETTQTYSWGGGIYCSGYCSPTIQDNTISGNTGVDAGGGIACAAYSSPTIQGNIISDNTKNGILCIHMSSPTIQGNTISGNTSRGIFCRECSPTIQSNTISGNTIAGIMCWQSSATVCNNIITFSTSGYGIYVLYGGSPSVSYCDVYGNDLGDYAGMADQTGSNGNISVDPLFAGGGDYHLQSTGGRWDRGSSSWMIDTEHSPCIDAGTGGPGDEPAPNGGVINMGAYGGTPEASKSKPVLPPPPPAPVMDPEPTYTQGTSNTVSWSAVAEAGDYYLEWDTEDGFATPEGNSGWITDTSHTATSLADGQIYYYHVRARNAGGESGWSNTVSSTQDATAPSSQVAPLPAYTSQTSFEVSWTSEDATSGVSHVNLYYQYGGGGQYMQFDGDLPEDGSITFTCPGGEGLYSFYTRATDNVRNVEDAPAIPDAQTLVDATPPTLSLDSPSPAILWPPNHKAVEVTISGSVVDNGSGVAQAWLVVDDEYDELDGTYDISGDLDEDGNFEITLELIAWRKGKDRDGRDYTISLYATDNAGNQAGPESVVVRVPHDQRKK